MYDDGRAVARRLWTVSCGYGHRETVKHGLVLIMAALCKRGAIIFLPCGFFLFSSIYLSFFYSQPSQVGCLPYFHTWCGPSANLECRSEMCCWRLAANAVPKESRQGHTSVPSGAIHTTVWSQYANVTHRTRIR